MDKQHRLNFIEHGDLKKVLLTMGIPAMLFMIITALYNVADAYFVSGLGKSYFGAVSVVFPILQIMIGIGLTFGSGAGVYISRLIGAENVKKANSVASSAIFSGIFVTIIITVILLVFLRQTLVLVGATDTMLSFAISYSNIIILGFIFTVFNIMIGNIVTSEGKPAKTMIYMSIGAILNIILDPILIYKMDMGINGAAYATVFSQGLVTFLYLVMIFRNENIVKINFKYIEIKKDIFLEILKIGIPIFMYQLFTSVSMSLTNIAAKPYGDDAIAAMGIMMRVTTIGLYIVFGFTKGFMPIIGINYGAGNYERVKKAIKITNKWGFLFCLIFGSILVFGSGFIANLFARENSEILISIATKALVYNGLLFVFFAYQNIYSSAFLAMGKAKEGGIINLSRQGIFFIPLILILPKFLGVSGVLIAQPLADLLTIVLTKYFISINRGLVG